MLWHLKRRTIGIVALIAALFCAMTACVKEHSEVSPKQPDKVLFEHALSAVEHSRFDVAHAAKSGALLLISATQDLLRRLPLERVCVPLADRWRNIAITLIDPVLVQIAGTTISSHDPAPGL